MFDGYKQAKRYIKRAQKKEDKDAYDDAIKLYEKAINCLKNDSLNQSYKIAQMYEKIAFCYENLQNIQNRSKSYQLAAKHYEKIGFFDNARMCRDLRMSPGTRLLRKKS